MAEVCGVSPRTIDYYTQRGLLEPSAWSPGHQRRYDERAVERLRRIKEMQAERLTLAEITARLATGGAAGAAGALTAHLCTLDEELDRLARAVGSLPAHLDGADSAERQAVAQVASLALAKTLLLAQWLTGVVRDGQAGPLG